MEAKLEAVGSLPQQMTVAKMSRVQFPPGSVHCCPFSIHVCLSPGFHLLASPGLVRDWCSLLQAAGEDFWILDLPPVSLLFYFPLGSEGIPVRLCEIPPLSRVPRYREMGMREVRPRNHLGFARGLNISTLNKRTRACISPSCHSRTIIGHGYRLTDKGEESVEVLDMIVELP